MQLNVRAYAMQNVSSNNVIIKKSMLRNELKVIAYWWQTELKVSTLFKPATSRIPNLYLSLQPKKNFLLVLTYFMEQSPSSEANWFCS